MITQRSITCHWQSVVLIAVFLAAPVLGGAPTDLLRGEAPLLFTGAEGEDAFDTVLADGVSTIRGDEIWLWVPAVTGGQVDLTIPGRFFQVWDSGPEAGPDGNDDDRNGMRGMDFDVTTGKFLISYEDSTTTGFAFGGIADGDLMELTPTNVSNGFITGFAWTRLFSECVAGNGPPDCIGSQDLNSFSLQTDGTLFYGPGGTQVINTDVPGTLSVGSGTLVHVDMNGPYPVNIGPDKFFEAALTGCPVIFCPGLYVGQLRGADVLDSGEVTFGTSGNYNNTVFTGPIDGLTDEEAEALAINVEIVCRKADLCSVPDLFNIVLNTYQRRTAEVLYAGSLFFQDPNVGDAEMLDHDILDTPGEVCALINLLDVDSDAGVALAEFASCGGGNEPVPTGSQWGLALMTMLGLCAGTIVFGARRRFAVERAW